MHSQNPDQLDRTQFLQRATLLMGAVVGATVAVPASVMATAPAFHTGSYYGRPGEPVGGTEAILYPAAPQ
jgi:hypothetical protein